MNTAYFSKVSHSMSWNKLKTNIVEQKKHGVRPLPYIIISKLYISSSDFNNLFISFSKPNLLYAPYAPLSVASPQGIWNCILIECIDNSKNVLFYTSGNIYPLYASIINH